MFSVARQQNFVSPTVVDKQVSSDAECAVTPWCRPDKLCLIVLIGVRYAYFEEEPSALGRSVYVIVHSCRTMCSMPDGTVGCRNGAPRGPCGSIRTRKSYFNML